MGNAVRRFVQLLIRQGLLMILNCKSIRVAVDSFFEPLGNGLLNFPFAELDERPQRMKALVADRLLRRR